MQTAAETEALATPCSLASKMHRDVQKCLISSPCRRLPRTRTGLDGLWPTHTGRRHDGCIFRNKAKRSRPCVPSRTPPCVSFCLRGLTPARADGVLGTLSQWTESPRERKHSAVPGKAWTPGRDRIDCSTPATPRGLAELLRSRRM